MFFNCPSKYSSNKLSFCCQSKHAMEMHISSCLPVPSTVPFRAFLQWRHRHMLMQLACRVMYFFSCQVLIRHSRLWTISFSLDSSQTYPRIAEMFIASNSRFQEYSGRYGLSLKTKYTRRIALEHHHATSPCKTHVFGLSRTKHTMMQNQIGMLPAI